jgi:hypothetical protein
VIEVHADGTVTDVDEYYYFEVREELGEDGIWHASESLPEGWELMRGYTGQYGYNGPHMHQSEYIGGRMARDILETPGLYVSLMVTPDCGYTEDFCNEYDGCQCEPTGWVVATKPAE